MVYDPNQYWIEHGRKQPGPLQRHEFRGNAVRKLQAALLPKLIGELKPKMVFEVGCGWGKMTALIRALPTVERMDAIDISPDRIAEAKRRVKGVSFYEGDFMDYDPAPHAYDVVFASEVLMHVPPAGLLDFMGKMRDMSSRYLVNLDYCNEKAGYLMPHNFSHPYEARYEELGAKSVRRTLLTRKLGPWTQDFHQSIFIAEFSP